MTEIVQEGNGTSLPDTDTAPLKDNRMPSLEIDLPSVSVHGIRAARFEYSTDKVRRDRYSYTSTAARHRGTSSGQDDVPY